MRRLYLQIYGTFLGILLLFGLLASVAWWLRPSDPQEQALQGLGTLLSEMLPGPERPADELQAVLTRLAGLLPAHFTVRTGHGTVLAATGRPLPSPPPHWTRSGWMHVRGAGPVAALLLPDGRWVLTRWQHPRAFGWLVALALLALTIALGAYPPIRRLTRRLERLQYQVEALGAGNLATRVAVEGRDEIAHLAQSFNDAADRIERLVNAQRTILAGVSHELRSPLARMRVALELLPPGERPDLRSQLGHDITELDELIGELLLASRLQTLDRIEQTEDVDLLALLAEEAARTAAEVRGESVCIQGDRRMLRRLIRNLLENARRYAHGLPVEASVTAVPPHGACLRVLDRGPGIATAERERIFEPFYRPVSRRDLADGGVGLGLALVRQIARHHGGEVCCLPRDGGGTCFEVTFYGPAPYEPL